MSKAYISKHKADRSVLRKEKRLFKKGKKGYIQILLPHNEPKVANLEMVDLAKKTKL